MKEKTGEFWKVMEILHILSGPVIGAVIGYFTNYLAVKMLFHPYHPVKVGRLVLPFTPGIIPKRREHLARALGRVVGDELLTGDDVKKILLSPEMEEKVAKCGIAALNAPEYGNLHQVCSHFMEEGQYLEKKEAVCRTVSRSIRDELEQMGISSLIVREGTRIVKEKVADNPILSMMLGDSVIASIAKPIGDGVDAYLQAHGEELMLPSVEKYVEHYSETPFVSLLHEWQIEEEKAGQALVSVYRKAVESQTDRAVRSLNIAGIVEEKVNAMSTPDLERLILSVMKKELSALVSLGAVIGFLIGIINCFL